MYFSLGLFLLFNLNKKDAPLRGRIGMDQRGRNYSFTPPRATPAMMYLLNAKYTMISGRAVMVRPR